MMPKSEGARIVLLSFGIVIGTAFIGTIIAGMMGALDEKQPSSLGVQAVPKEPTAPTRGQLGAMDTAPPGSTAAPPQAGSSAFPKATAEIVERTRRLALTNITANFQLNEYSQTIAQSQTSSGHWVVTPTESDCRDDEICYDVIFEMQGASDRPTWRFRFDRTSGELNREWDIDEDLNDKYFMLRPSSRGSRDTRP